MSLNVANFNVIYGVCVEDVGGENNTMRSSRDYHNWPTITLSLAMVLLIEYFGRLVQFAGPLVVNQYILL